MKLSFKLFLTVCFLSLGFSGNSVSANLEPGDSAPNFSMTRTDGKKETLKTLVGPGMERSIVVLSFFDTNCKPCLRELPHITALYKKYRNTRKVKIRLVGLDTTGKKAIDPYIKKHNVIIPVLVDREGLYAGEKYGVVSYGRAKVPKLFVISKNKVIKKIFSGFKEGEEKKFETTLTNLIENLRKEKVVKEYPNNITILYSNSTNGYFESCDCPENPFGGLVRRATTINKIRRNTDVLLVDSGDHLSPYPNKLRGKYIFKMLALMDYDALGVGDQEFINGPGWFNNLIEKKTCGDLPFLCTNIQMCDDKLCWNLTRPYIITKVGKYKVGIISILNASSVYSFMPPPKELKIKNSTETIKTYVKLLREEKKVDIVVLLSHSGFDTDKNIAKQVSGIDAIIGGHSQTLIETPREINNTIIVQAGENGQRLGKLVLNYDDYGKRTSYGSDFTLLTKNIKDNAAIRELINRYNKEVKEQAGKALSK